MAPDLEGRGTPLKVFGPYLSLSVGPDRANITRPLVDHDRVVHGEDGDLVRQVADAVGDLAAPILLDEVAKLRPRRSHQQVIGAV
jgi:hypothetical protein